MHIDNASGYLAESGRTILRFILNNAGLRVLTGCIKLSNNRGEQHIPVNVGMRFPGAQNVMLNYLVIDSSR